MGKILAGGIQGPHPSVWKPAEFFFSLNGTVAVIYLQNPTRILNINLSQFTKKQRKVKNSNRNISLPFIACSCSSWAYLVFTTEVSLVPAQFFGACSTLFWKFSPFYDYIMLMWEKIPGSPRFSTGCVSRIVQSTTCSTLSVYNNHPLLARYMR